MNAAVSVTSIAVHSIVGIDIDETITSPPVHVVSSSSPSSRLETTLWREQYGVDFNALFLLPNFGSRSIAAPAELGWYDKNLWQKAGDAMRHWLTHFYDDDRRVHELFSVDAPGVTLNLD